jgi:putative redox protein
MQISVSYKSNFKFEATTRGHTIVGDRACEDGGDDAGMTPPEWFLASLGSCVGFYALKYCQARGLDPSGLMVDVSAQKITEQMPRLDHLQIHLSLPIALNTHHQRGLEKAVESCLIHNTLNHPPQITTEISSFNFAPKH